MPTPSENRAKYMPMAVYAAKAYGIDPNFFLAMLDHELPSWDPEQISDDKLSQGLGQVTFETARGMGIDPTTLKNPEVALGASAQIVSRLMQKYNNDWWKVYAAYNAGDVPVDQSIQMSQALGGDWRDIFKSRSKDYVATIDAADKIIKNAPTAGNPSNAAFAASAAKNYGTTPSADTNPFTGFDPSKPLDPSKFMKTDPTGAQYFDKDSWDAAVAASNNYWTSKKNQQEYEFGPFQQMMDEITKDMASGIASGNLQATKASGILSNRATAYKTGLDALNSDSFKWGAPVGAEYIPGTEPGGALSHFGVKPIPALQNNIVDPLSWAVQQANAGDQLYGNIQVPTLGQYTGGLSLPDYIKKQQDQAAYLAMIGNMQGGTTPTMTSTPPGPPPTPEQAQTSQDYITGREPFNPQAFSSLTTDRPPIMQGTLPNGMTPQGLIDALLRRM